MERQRLDKFLSSQLPCTRSEARDRIRHGRVSVDGVTVRDPAAQIDPDAARILADGTEVSYQCFLYLMMNKPAGILTATQDKHRETVLDLVPEQLHRRELAPVGRLDRDTTGLLLLTDDGAFAHTVISPKSGIPKTYIAQLDGDVTGEMVTTFKTGVTLADGTVCKPAQLVRIGENTAQLTLYEGKYHEVKRMFGTVGLGVNALHRQSVGDLVLPEDLAPGACRELDVISLQKVVKNLENQGVFERRVHF